MTGVDAAIGLGSNLGDRRRTLESALAMLDASPSIEVTACSGFIETAPVGPVEQPRFMNAAATVRTTLAARELMAVCLSIESTHGRRRSPSERWGPRTLDLDVLLYGDRTIDEPGLTVPHPRLVERPFALIPLAEIADSWVHPGEGATIQCLRDALAATVE
jgi:2-amino-4-hydroxy-6-hydroxymethyldihydropteridine diphosphokinase